ncbi:cardiolipin synthetase [Rhodococcus sp. Br-6]|nr:cardiolipin synthetase [Rhodococcus sp. Br-6]
MCGRAVGDRFNVGMTQGFFGGHPWEAIAEAVGPARRRHAAVAFLGADAPRILPMKRGDTLVVNASDSAVRSRATSPAAIAEYLQAGVLVYNERELHAKVIATSRCAVVGSANASTRSRDLALEAVVITEDPTVVSEVKQFVVDLAESPKRLTDRDLPRLQKLWEEGEENDPDRAVPGVNRDPEDLITDFSAGFVLEAMGEGDVDPATSAKITRRVRRGNRDSRIGVDWLILPRGDKGYPVGTVLFEVDEDGVDPPKVITDEPTPFPDNPRSRYQPYRYVRDHQWCEWDELDGTLENLASLVDEASGSLNGSFEEASGIGPALLARWGIEMPTLPPRKKLRRREDR